MNDQTLRRFFPSIPQLSRSCGPLLAALAVLANPVFAQGTACDLDGSGSVNVVDVNRAVSMVLGTVPCTASVEGLNTCTIVTVQRVVNSALGQPCIAYNSLTHTVGLTWLASPSTGVVGYNVYRRSTATGTPVKLNSAIITGTSFTDTTIQLGQTYYYSATSVDTSGVESAQSSQAVAIIPTI